MRMIVFTEFLLMLTVSKSKYIASPSLNIDITSALLKFSLSKLSLYFN